MADNASRSPVEFSLSGGGPAFAIMNALRLPPETGRRPALAAFVLAAAAWLPLLVLSIVQGVATGDSVRMPFLRDVSAYARLLVAVPAFILIGPIIDRWLGIGLRGIVEGGIVRATRRTGLDAALDELDRGREAWLPEAILVAGCLALMWLESQRDVHASASTWIATGTPVRLTWAGVWFVSFGLPLFFLLAGRWGWRLLLWARFLWRVSKLDLDLVPSHPDGFGGLGVLSTANALLGLVMMPFSVTLAANAVDRVLYEGESILDMKIVLGVYLVLAILLTQGPLLVFGSAMRRAKFEGLVAFGLLAEHYSRDFDRKWIPRLHPHLAPDPPPEGEKLLGSADIQSLADMGNSFAFAARMRPALLEPRMLGVVAAMAAVPMLPPLALVVPLKDVLEKLTRLLLH